MTYFSIIYLILVILINLKQLYNVFFLFINRSITINTYFIKMLLKANIKMSYNTYKRVNKAFEKD